MASTEEASNYGRKPPTSFKPRTTGSLPWDVDKQVRQKPSTVQSRRHPFPARTQSESDKYSQSDVVDKEELLDEAALLKELDEVLSSTSESSSMIFRNNQRSGYNAKRKESEPKSQNEDLEMLHIQGHRVRTAPLKEAETIQVQEHATDVRETMTHTQDTRAPRYHGQFTNYEEMLRSMDAGDPFNQGDSLSVDQKPPVGSAANRGRPAQRSAPKAYQPKAVGDRHSNSKTEPDQHQVPKLRGKPKKTLKAEEVISSLGGALDGIENKGFDNTAQLNIRRDSMESQKTYIVGRTDSRVGLVDEHIVAKVAEKSFNEVTSSVVNLKNLRKKLLINHKPNNNKDDPHLNEEDISAFVRNNISQRECSKYMPDLNKNDGRCKCGHSPEFHAEIGLNVTSPPAGSGEEWNPDVHTRRVAPDSYGTIAFHGFGQEISRHAPYIRLDYKSYESGMEALWNLLSDHWNIVPPKLVISVTGGAKRFFMKTRLKNSLKRGLINAATSTGAWIITGGTSTGVMEFIGEAVRDHMLTSGASEQPVVALGIATWGIVDNKEALVSDDGLGMFPAQYNVDDLSTKSVRGVAALDPNHSHFILVDNGTHGKFGAEIKFRAALEHFISERMETGVAKNQSVHVPVVMLVLEGGQNTLQTAAEAIANHTPVVIIQGSGRAADFIALAFRITRSKDGDEDKNDFPPTFDEDMKNRATTVFDWSREKDAREKERKIAKCVTTVRRCLQHRHLLTVFHIDDVDTTNEIDQAILYALLKANKSDAQSQLNLALAWNRCDVARQEIFSIENRTNWQRMDLQEAVFTALIQDRADFVQLFLDNGVDLKHFLTVPRLRDLYDDVVNSGSRGGAADLILHLLQQVELPSDLFLLGFTAPTHCSSGLSVMSCCRRDRWMQGLPDLLHIVGRLITNLLIDQQDNLYKGSKFVVDDLEVDKGLKSDYRVAGETGDVTYPHDHSTSPRHRGGGQHDVTSPTDAALHKGYKCSPPREKFGRGKHSSPVAFAQPERDLFLWAVLLNRRDLAMLFWRTGRDHIGGALMASALLKSLAKKADQEEELDLAVDLGKHSDEWEERAVGVLNECYQKDKQLSHSVLTREVDRWGGLTLFMMADSAFQMDFMGHSCCQTKLNRIWKGKMALYTSMWKIILTMFVPLLLPLIRFSPQEFTVKKSKRNADRRAVSNEGAVLASSFKNQMYPSSNGKDTNHGGGDEDGDFPDGRDFVPAPDRGASRKQLTEKLYHVDVCAGCSSRTLANIFAAMYCYYTAPVTKFCFYTVSYIIFLSIFSYFVLTDLNPVVIKPPSILEYIIWGWAASLLAEEIRQIAIEDPKSLTYKLAGYFSSIWNRFDLGIQLMFVTSIILRYLLPPESFVWARVVYSITLGMYFLRFMQFFFVQKNVGPKVIMIKRMLTDLAFFIAIFLVVLLAYGVASQALLYPNSPPSWTLIKDVIYKPYWQMYGELFLDELEGNIDDCSTDPNIWQNVTQGVRRCPEKSMLPLLLFVVYMIMTNILLLNLLIAMFSHTFERVQENSEKVWRFYRYSLVYEYFDKPAMVPPLIILNHIFRVFKYCTRCCREDQDRNTDFRQKLSAQENKRLTAFERSGMETYLLKQSKVDREHIDAKVSSATERIEKVIEDLEQIKEQVSAQSPSPSEKEEGPVLSNSMEPPPHLTSPADSADLRALHRYVQDLDGKLMLHMKAMNQVLEVLGQFKHSSDVTATSVPAGFWEQPGSGPGPTNTVSVSQSTSPSSSTRSSRHLYPRPAEPQIEIQDIGTDPERHT